MISMTFVSMLLIVIAFTAIQIINIYNKGLTMNRVAQAARAMNADFHRTLSDSGALDLSKSTFLCLQLAAGGCLELNPHDPPPAPNDSRLFGGRLCTGVYSYIWNYNKKKNEIDNDILRVNSYTTSDSSMIRLVRVDDNGGKYCAKPGLDINPSGKTEILSDTGGLAVLGFSIEDISLDPSDTEAVRSSSLYHIVMEVGTDNPNALKLNDFRDPSRDPSCKPPSDDSNGLRNFCAVNRIDFTVLAGNNGGSI
ncbi:hypothetical protein KC953_00355, partial [Candidatus Saccharibacteria bacterium]|nr:hypothetical protein [Candidatus Saccharibacteria bacterium]